MASKAFSNTLSNLASDKLKDRTQGLEDVRLFLSLPRNIEWMNEDRKQWLKFLQYIFQIVVDEQRAYVSKPTTPALKRLKDAAQAVRLIIEKAAADIPRKAFRAVFNHILSIIVVRNQLFEPIALEYLKALRASINYPPHLDHLDTKQWTHAVSVCFSAILGDPIRDHQLSDDHALDEEDDEDQVSTQLASKKRKAGNVHRASSTATDATSASGSSQKKSRLSASQDIIELCGCIEAFFGSSQAPLVVHGDALLSKLVRFFDTFANETTAHLSMMTALNRLLGELEFNRKALIEKAVGRLWPVVVAMWHSKNVAMKEQLVMAATLLLPYTSALESERQALLASDLYFATLIDVESRWGTEVLDLHALSLCCTRQTGASRPLHGFTTSQFQAGPAFDFQQALAWTVIHLCASCLRQVARSASNVGVEPPTPSRASKRLRPTDPFSSLLADMTSPDYKVVVHRMQVFVFLHELDHNVMPAAAVQQLGVAAASLLAHQDASVQSWAMLLLARTATATYRDSPIATPVEGDRRLFWMQVWEKGLKMCHQPATSRAACYLLLTISSIDIIDTNRLTKDLVTVALDIEVQGPPVPSDAASYFLQLVLQTSSTDFRTYKHDIAGKICSRMISHWHWPLKAAKASRAFTQRVKVEPVDAHALLELFVSTTFGTSSNEILPPHSVVLPDGYLTFFWNARQTMSPLRAWFWDAVLPGLSTSANGESGPSSTAYAMEPRTNTIAVRIVLYLRKLVDELLGELEEADELYWGLVPLERLRSMIDLIWLSIAFDAYIDEMQVIRNEYVQPRALHLLQLVMPRLEQSKWTVTEKASLLNALSPLFVDPPRYTESYEVLVQAGPSSGIRRSVLEGFRKETDHDGGGVSFSLLPRIWTTPGALQAFASKSPLFQRFLEMHTGDSISAQEDADFGPIRITTSTQMTGRAMLDPGSSLATRTCMSVAVQMLVTMAYYQEAGGKPGRLRPLMKSLLEDTGARFILVGDHVLDAVSGGYLVLSSNELEAIVEKIGMELLPSYEYSHTQELAMFVLKFLIATVPQWGKEEAIEMPYVDKARRLAAWFAGQLLSRNIQSWRVRCACIDLLDQFTSPKGLNALAFGHDTEALACRDGVPIPPGTILINLLNDPDYRVRFKLAPVMGHVCSQLHQEGKQSFSVWTGIIEKSAFDFQGINLELNTTTLLAYINIMIASDFFRSNAYHPIIVLAALDASKSVGHFVKAGLAATAERLGLKDLATLYAFLAPFTLAEQLYNSQERLLVPDPSAFGFPNKQSLYAARFDETAPMVLAGPRPQFFQDLCAYVGTDEKAALARVFPTYVAYKLTAGVPGSDVCKLAEQDIALKAVEVASNNGQLGSDMLRNMRDLVVWRLFSFIWEAEYSLDIISATFNKCWPESSPAEALLRQCFNSSEVSFHPNVLSPPDVRLAAILASLQRCHPAVAGALEDEGVLYSILHRLLCAVAEPPFTSQQLRLLHNTVICIACAINTFSRSTALLSMVLQRLAALASQPDLLVLVSRIFMWTLRQSLSLRRGLGEGLQAEVLSILRAADAAVHLSREANERTKFLALQFLQALEDFEAPLRKDSNSGIVLSAAQLRMLWPQSSVGDQESASFQELKNTIESSENAFGLCNALSILRTALPLSPTPEDRHMVAKLLWIILSRLDAAAVTGNTRSDLVESFAYTLYWCGGVVSPPALEDCDHFEARAEATHLSLKANILQNISSLLSVSDLATVHLAFETLLHIVSGSPDTLPLLSGAELQLFKSPQIRRNRLYNPTTTASSDLRALLEDDYWFETSHARGKWQQTFAAFLADSLGKSSAFYGPCSEVLSKNANLAKECLPWLVSAILLEQDGTGARAHLSQYFELLLDRSASCAADVLDIVLKLRAFLPPDDFAHLNSPLLYDLWLSVPYFKLARVAMEARDCYAALLCVELAQEHPSNRPVIKIREEKEVLYQIYSTIQEPDGFYSISASDLPGGLIRRLHHEERWLEALSWHGAELEAAPQSVDGTKAMQQVLACMAHGNLGQLAMNLFRANSGSSVVSEEILSDLAWKTQSWDIPVPQYASAQSPYQLYIALKAAGGLDVKPELEQNLLTAVLSEIAGLTTINTLSPSADESRLHDVLALREILRWRNDPSSSLSEYSSDMSTFFKTFPYKASETILRVRAVLINRLRAEEARKSLSDEPSALDVQAKEAERMTLLTLSALARSTNHSQTALNAVLRCQHVARDRDPDLALATASVLWLQTESVAAIETLRQFLRDHQKHLSDEEHARLLSQMGTWTATARLEDASTVREEYFEQAWHRIRTQDTTLTSTIAFQYARFADNQYQQTSQQVAEIDQLDSYTRKKEDEVQQLVKQSKASQGPSSELASRRRVASAISQQDRQTVDQFRLARKALLESAVDMYGHALSGPADDADGIFRLCSLWLGNSEDDAFCANAAKSITSIPSHRFISLVPQLSARLATMQASGKAPFQSTLTKLVERLAVEHPFHSLFQLYFLYNTNAGQASQSTSQRRRSAGVDNTNGQSAIKELILRVRRLPNLREITQSVELAIEAYADWAATRVEKHRPPAEKLRPIPSNIKLLRLKNMPIPITTLALPVDKSCTYDSAQMPCIVGYKNTYTTAGGVNLPKITDCLASDGAIYRQLFKGGDDVRQDAVMQQIFGVTNDLLSRDDRTSARSLGIRTYRVIPLLSDCGLLEYVANSQAIGDWLVPAHKRYRPDDMPILDARKMLGEKQKASEKDRVEVYKKILKRVHPVMRHFFTEKHHVPYWWFQMRLNYARSAAAMSMIGYVMGIGDRHVSNIMIDTGKQLPTPEHVPFRLTPDIVDGFGISGVEGVFRKCSEETIRVLRSKSSVLMTILEVFKYDPLQKWTASASKVKRVQGSQVLDRSDEGSRLEELTDADRAIRTVSEKLRSDLSVEYNVNDLILQARDVVKLGTIFFGWQPYL